MLEETFIELIDVDEDIAQDEKLTDNSADNSASVSNPNKDDDRRLFQIRNVDFSWDPTIPYEQQPNRIDRDGPTALLFPDHFYEVMGGVVIIYFQKSRSTACICSIRQVEEETGTFIFRVYGWQGKSRQTYHDTGKDSVVHESKVWRMVHRKEFEKDITPKDIHKGLPIRVSLRDEIMDFSWIPISLENERVTVRITTGMKSSKLKNFALEDVATVTEIMSFPLMYRLKKLVAGEAGGQRKIS